MKAILSVAGGGPETLVIQDMPDLAPKPGAAAWRRRCCSRPGG
jgi:hypothetical protein